MKSLFCVIYVFLVYVFYVTDGRISKHIQTRSLKDPEESFHDKRIPAKLSPRFFKTGPSPGSWYYIMGHSKLNKRFPYLGVPRLPSSEYVDGIYSNDPISASQGNPIERRSHRSSSSNQPSNIAFESRLVPNLEKNPMSSPLTSDFESSNADASGETLIKDFLDFLILKEKKQSENINCSEQEEKRKIFLKSIDGSNK